MAIIFYPSAGSSSYFYVSENSLHFDEGTCYFLAVNKTVQGTKFKIQHSQKAIIRAPQLHEDTLAAGQLRLLVGGSEI